MGKKLFIFIISTLVLSATLALPTLADDEPEKGYWTFEEVAAAEEEIAEEARELCADAYDYYACVMDVYYDAELRGGLYEAILAYNYSPLEIRAINLNDGTIRLSFRGANMDTRLYKDEPGFTLKDIYIARFENGLLDAFFFEKMKYGEELLFGTHAFVGESEDINGYNWFPASEIREFDIIDNEITPDTAEYISIHLVTDAAIFYNDFDFSSCVNSPEYDKNMECKGVFVGSEFTFVPSPIEHTERKIITENQDIESQEDNVALQTGEDTAIESQENTPQPAEEEVAAIAPIVPLAPNTGAKTCKTEAEFPWWLVVTLIISDILVMWWITPNRKPKKQLAPWAATRLFEKIFEKSLDKTDAI